MRWKKLGIIAGAGALPARLAKACQAIDRPFFVVRLQGAADHTTEHLPSVDCGIGEAGRIIRVLKENDCDALVMAGVVRRPDFASLKADWRGAALLPRVVGAAARGDGALLNVLVDTFEAEGFKVIGAEEVAEDLAVGGGALTDAGPTDDDMADIKKAAAVISALGPFDVGQGAVVAEGLVLAIEAAEGTDEMVERVRVIFDADSNDRRRGVLVKRPKPGQELRVDLPTIGLETVRRTAAAGLAGIAVEKGRTLLMDADATIAAANAAGLFLYGFTAEDIQ